MEFIDPPENVRTRRSAIWAERVKTLKENPTRWALIGDFSPGVPSQIRSGAYRAFIPADIEAHDIEGRKRYMTDNWEVRTVRQGEGTRTSMWIRWIG